MLFSEAAIQNQVEPLYAAELTLTRKNTVSYVLAVHENNIKYSEKNIENIQNICTVMGALFYSHCSNLT